MFSKKNKKVTSTKNKNATKDKSKKKKIKKRAVVETDTKSKEQRRKILEVRSMQSRFVLPTLAEIETYEATQISKNDEIKSNENDIIVNNEEQEQDVVFLQLSESQEDDINALELNFAEYDEDYYGFIEYDKFLSILKENKINLSNKQETFLMIALTLIDEGVDYYGFLQILRNKASIDPNSNLTKICQRIAINAEQKANAEFQRKEEAKDAEIEVDEDELNKFYEAAQNAELRGMSLSQMNKTSMIIPSTNKIRQIIEQFALDGVEIDFAIFKTALSVIGCHPNDNDVIFLINYLSIKDKENINNMDTMDNDELFVDFNYFISFCQEVSNIPVMLWKNPDKIIEKVARQTRMVYRTQERRKIDKIKAKKRLENREKARNEKNKQSIEWKQIEAEEKRLRTLRLRDKAKMVSAPKKGEEKIKLKEWISKRGKKQSKKNLHELKKWMQKNNLFQKNLYSELISNDVISMDLLKNVSVTKMDIMLRKVRSDRFAEVRNQSSRNKIDKILISFEKKWRKMANINGKQGKAKKKSKKKKKK